MARSPRRSDLDPDGSVPSLFELLWQVTAFTHLEGEAALADTPLTVASGSMLVLVADEPGMTVAEISRRIPKTQQTISQVTARLEKLGLVERRLGTGRGVGLHATDAGLALARTARRSEQEVDERLRDALGEQQSATLAALLARTLSILRDER